MSNGDIEGIEASIKKGVNLNRERIPGNGTILHHAVLKGRDHLVTMLIEAGADVDAQDSSGGRPLHYAASRSIDAVKSLCSHGADVNAVNDENETPLFSAAESSMRDIVEFLVENGGSSIDHVNNNSDTVLHKLALNISGNESIETLKKLIEYDIDINATDKNGVTVLHWAACMDQVGDKSGEFTRLLIQHGADVSVQDRMGKSPTYWACEHNNIVALEQILLSGPDVNVPESIGSDDHPSPTAGRTASHWAALHGNREMLNMLVEAGAVLSVQDSSNMTPKDFAQRSKYWPDISNIFES